MIKVDFVIFIKYVVFGFLDVNVDCRIDKMNGVIFIDRILFKDGVFVLYRYEYVYDFFVFCIILCWRCVFF